jgi:predicted transposase/invertase (TIGR01784 family)
MEILSASSDYIFKLLFADERNIVCLKSFLHAVLGLPEAELRQLTITDPFLQKECEDDKMGILDVKLETASGQVIDIEMQLWDIPDIRSRISFYLARMVAEQLGSGDKYRQLRRAISIIITDFTLVKESENYHTVFQMLERTEHFPFNNLMEIQCLDLTNLPTNQSDDLVNWLRFIKTEREEEMKMLAQTNPAIQQAYTFLRELSADEATRLRNEARLKARRDEWSRLEGAEEKGVAKGAIQKSVEIVQRMAHRGMDVADIADLTGLDSTQVDEILQGIAAK